MTAQPFFDDVRGAARQDVDAPPGLGVDEHGGVAAAAAQREVIHAQHRGTATAGRGIRSKTRRRCRETRMPSASRSSAGGSRKITSSPSRPPAWTQGRSSAVILAPLDHDLLAGLYLPRHCRGSATPARRRHWPGCRVDPDHRAGAAAASARHRHPPGETGPTRCTGPPGAPPPAPRPPKPTSVGMPTPDNTMITTSCSCLPDSTTKCVAGSGFDQLCAWGTPEPEPVAGGNRCASYNRARPSRWRRRAHAIRHPAPPRGPKTT